MLQSVSGVGVYAPWVARNTPVHQLSLRFGADRFRVERQDPPWKVVRAFPLRDRGALVHLNNVSGGVLAGDRLALDINVGPGAAAQITTTGATRLYRHRAGAADSEQRTMISVGANGLVEYLPDAVIPYAGSRHLQHTEILLGPGSNAFWWEVLAPGRAAAGESFAFERLRVHSEIRTELRPILHEDFLLRPAGIDLFSAVRMYQYSHLASFFSVAEGRPAAFWRSLEDRLNEVAHERTITGESVWAASMLGADGVVVRGLSRSTRFVYPALLEFWSKARIAITGREIEPPRKTY